MVKPLPRVAPDFVVERDACKASFGATGLCTLPAGHDGPHRFLDCEGAAYRLPDGSTVPFMGTAR